MGDGSKRVNTASRFLLEAMIIGVRLMVADLPLIVIISAFFYPSTFLPVQMLLLQIAGHGGGGNCFPLNKIAASPTI